MALYRNSRSRRNLRAEIALWRGNVLDCEVVVDDCRADVDRHVEALRVAVRQRDEAVAHLERLIELHQEIEDVAETFGREVATNYAATFGEASL